jgi:hypothetical protein
MGIVATSIATRLESKIVADREKASFDQQLAEVRDQLVSTPSLVLLT